MSLFRIRSSRSFPSALIESLPVSLDKGERFLVGVLGSVV